MFTTVIVDDEFLAREIIKKRLELFPEFSIVGEAANGFDAFKLLQETKPDVLFLDIQMPKINGFELLEMLEERPVVVFVTAYDEYAIQAFNKNATDYLMKPFSEQRFAEAITKTKERLLIKEHHKKSNENFHYHGENDKNRLIVKETGRILIIPTDEIIMIEAQDDYALITTTSKKYLKKTTLKDLEQRLDSKYFFRVHRSYMVHFKWIDEILRNGKDLYSLALKNGHKLPVSKSGYDLLKSQFKLDD